MLLTEQIQLKSSKELSELCHKAKNLYNSANWYYRQDFFKLDNFLSYYDLNYILKDKEVYRNLPAQTSQKSRWIKCSCSFFNIVWLPYQAASFCPELIKFYDYLLKSHKSIFISLANSLVLSGLRIYSNKYKLE